MPNSRGSREDGDVYVPVPIGLVLHAYSLLADIGDDDEYVAVAQELWRCVPTSVARKAADLILKQAGESTPGRLPGAGLDPAGSNGPGGRG